jgi:uncharacterized protein YjiK
LLKFIIFFLFFNLIFLLAEPTEIDAGNSANDRIIRKHPLFPEKPNRIPAEELQIYPEKVIKLAIPEPSDLCLIPDSEMLWCVSDKTGFLYKIDFEGVVKEKYNYGFYDTEGVCIQDNYIWVLEERINRVNKIENGKVTKRIDLIKSKKKNSGMEGITYNPDKKEFYVANEKAPAVIYIYDSSFTYIKEKKVQYLDISALCYDSINKYLWVLSHEESAIYILDDNFYQLHKIKIDVKQAEGIALDYKNGCLYICSDADSLFYIYKIPEFLLKNELYLKKTIY